MKATLEFDLELPGDRESHLRAVKSLDMASVLFEFSTNSRKKIANRIYENKGDKTPLDIAYDEFFSLMESHGINMDELIS